MALSNKALTTVAKLKLSGTVETADKEEAIERASQMIITMTDRDFIKKSHTETYRGNNKQRLLLKNYPVLSVTSLSIDDETIEPSDLTILSDEGIIEYEDGVFTDTGYHDIEITYVAGYILNPEETETRNLPYDIEWACARLAEILYSAGSSRSGSTAFTIPPRITETINDYVRPVSV